jgi:hypothetical protein
MSGLVARLPFPVLPWLTVVQLRTRLAQAERALDHPFDRRRSLELDQAVLAYETARRRAGHRRRAA